MFIQPISNNFLAISLEDILCLEREARPLHSAIKTGNKEKVAELLKNQELDVNSLDTDDNTPLNLAVKLGDKETVKILLNNANIDVNKEDLNNNTPLDSAINLSNSEMVKLLLPHKDINLRDYHISFDNSPPLHRAVISGDEEIVKMLLQHEKINVNALDEAEESVLHIALKQGQMHILYLLLQDPRIDVRPAIETAIINHEISDLRFLLTHPKININAPYHEKYFLDMAVKSIFSEENVTHEIEIRNAVEIVKELLNYKEINVNIIDDEGNTPLHNIADIGEVKFEYFDIIKLLSEKKADLKIKNKKGETFLHILAKNQEGNFGLVLNLLKIIDQSSFGKNKSLFISFIYEKYKSDTCRNLKLDNVDILKMLNRGNFFSENYSSRVNLRKRKLEEISGLKLPNNIGLVSLLNDQDNEGNTPLHRAVMAGNIHAVLTLLQCPVVAPNLMNLQGKTPIMIAKENEHSLLKNRIYTRLNLDRLEMTAQETKKNKS